jgi:NAD(P)H-dependent flavin oxidoreductase YrpB (nitropropane dioxygenase family)
MVVPADAAAAGWPDRRLLDLLGIELPIIQAPMAGATSGGMLTAVAAAGGLGSLPCATLDDATVLTNVFTGRPACGLVNRLVRDIGPLSPDAPPFPLAAAALVPLREATEAKGGRDFSALWCGQAAPLGRDLGAGALTRQLAADALHRLRGLARPND